MTTSPNGETEKPPGRSVKPNVFFTEESKNAAVKRLKKRGWQLGAGVDHGHISARKIMKAIRWILVIAIVGAMLAWFTYRQLSTRRIETQRTAAMKAEKQQHKNLVYSMVHKWNAVEYIRKGSWPEDQALGHDLFTVDVEDCLIRPDGRPILFLGFVKDVQRRGDKYLIHVDSEAPPIHCLLECGAAQIVKIRSKTDAVSPHFAVVAKIASVARPFLKVSPTKTEDGEAEITVDSPETFVASGVCLDLLGPYE